MMSGRAGFVRTQWVDAATDFKKLSDLFQQGQGIECLVIEFMTEYRGKYGDDEFLTRCESTRLFIDLAWAHAPVYGNPVLQASFNGSADLLRKLLGCGMRLDVCTDSNDLLAHGLSPIMLAALRGRSTVAKILLDRGADLFYRAVSERPVITYATTVEVCDVMLSAAKERNCLHQLLQQRCSRERLDIWHACSMLGHAAALNSLVRVPNLNDYTDIHSLLALTTSSPLNYPDLYAEFKIVSDYLREIMPPSVRQDPVAELDLQKDVCVENELPKCYQHLFGEEMDPTRSLSREYVLKLANAKYFSLLMNPKHCLPYLRFLSQEFERYYQEKFPGLELPTLDKEQFDFRVMAKTYYPLPRENSMFTKHSRTAPYHKKHSALQEFLLLLLRKHGMGDRAIKWLGFVPRQLANEHVADGNLILEGKYNSVSVLHGALPHMLQLAIMIYAIEAGDISLHYEENGVIGCLTVNDLNRSQVSIPSVRHPNASIFADIRDNRYFNRVSFVDPHRLVSVIMHDGEALGMTALSHYVTDSFCKSIWKFFLTVKKCIPELKRFDEFIDMMSGLPSEVFLYNVHFNMLAAAKYQLSPHKFQIHQSTPHGFSFLTVDVNYQPNRHFEPRSFAVRQEVREKSGCVIF